MTEDTTDRPARAPAEERAASWLEHTHHAPRLARGLRRLAAFDRELYTAVARAELPLLDRPVRVVSDAANYSRPWFVVAAVMATVGGPRGRRAAVAGVASIAVTSLLVNQPMKLIGRRERPDRVSAGVPEPRWVDMPTSSSFPSGHAAAGTAFAVSVGTLAPVMRLPLGAAATVVAASRVYTGVHYPGDVLVGAGVGALVGSITARALRRR